MNSACATKKLRKADALPGGFFVRVANKEVNHDMARKNGKYEA